MRAGVGMLCSNLKSQQKKPEVSVSLWSHKKTPRAGFEPATNRLTVDRSTAELPRNAKRT
tara:strand:- start:47122 stop:47301 length:180 start_codon:yes stop_codon:yes gene_type:complete